MEDLTPLFNLLCGSEDLGSPTVVTLEAQESIARVQEALSSWEAHCYEPSLPFLFTILGKEPCLYALIFQ